MKDKILERKEILSYLSNKLEPLDYVYGMWQGGSAAFERVDEWSDINIIVDVEDDKMEELFKFTDKTLDELSPIESVFGGPQPLSQGAYQKAYKLRDTSKFMLIEVCGIKNSSSYKFLEREIHGNIIIHFDKVSVTNYKTIDKADFANKLKKRVENIEKLFFMYQFLIEKELNRKNYIEALSFYQSFSLSPLVELLRIKHRPYRYNFKTRYIYYDLPEDIIKKLNRFYFIKNGKKLKSVHEETVDWFNDLLLEVRDLNLEELL